MNKRKGLEQPNDCHKFVSNDGASSNAIAAAISKVRQSSARLTVGNPKPTIPFTTPAVKKAATKLAIS